MNNEPVGAQAFFAVQRAMVGDSEPKFFPPLHELPVRRVQVNMVIPPLPVDPADQSTCQMRSEREDHINQNDWDKDVIHSFSLLQFQNCGDKRPTEHLVVQGTTRKGVFWLSLMLYMPVLRILLLDKKRTDSLLPDLCNLKRRDGLQTNLLFQEVVYKPCVPFNNSMSSSLLSLGANSDV